MAWLFGAVGVAADAAGVSLGRGATPCIAGSGVFALLDVGVLRQDLEVVSLAVADWDSGLEDASRGGDDAGLVVCCWKRRRPMRRTRSFSGLVKLRTTPFTSWDGPGTGKSRPRAVRGSWRIAVWL